MVVRRWTYPRTGRAQRDVGEEIVALVVRLACENPRWGYLRIVGGRLVDACHHLSALVAR